MLDSEVAAKPRVRAVEPEAEHSDVASAIRAPATALRPTTVMGLQRTAGNAAVTALLQRKMAADEDQEEAESPVLDVVGRGGGEPLAADVKAEMESRLDDDFSNVRVHTDAEAAESAAAVDARAYTVGNEVVFGADSPTLDSDQGKRILAHELTHVVQQRNGPVAGTPTGDGISISDPSDQFEQAAESNATRAMSGQGVDTHPAAAAPGGPALAAAQRLEADEEEGAEQDSELVEPDLVEDEDVETGETEEEEPAVQGMWVQRDPADTYTLGDQEEDEEEAESEEQARDTEELTDEMETEEDEAPGEAEDEAEESEVEEEEATAEAEDEAQEAEEESE